MQYAWNLSPLNTRELYILAFEEHMSFYYSFEFINTNVASWIVNHGITILVDLILYIGGKKFTLCYSSFLCNKIKKNKKNHDETSINI